MMSDSSPLSYWLKEPEGERLEAGPRIGYFSRRAVHVLRSGLPMSNCSSRCPLA